MKNKIIIFDIDDTLYNEIDYVKSGYKVVAKYIEEKNKVNGIFNKMMALFEKSKKNVFNRLYDELGIAYTDEDIKYLVDLYRNHRPDIRLSKKTIDTLVKLRKKYNLAVVSDGNYKTQKLKSHALELKKYFDEIILTDKYGKEYWKPNKKAFEMISEKFKIEMSNMYYVGDNPNKDFYISVYGINTIRLYNKKGIYYFDNYKDGIDEIIKISRIEDLKEIFLN